MATRRNRTNGRFSKQTRTRSRRRNKAINLTNTAQSLLIANAMTHGIFGSNLMDFFTGKMDGVYKAGSDGSARLTLPELLGFAGAQGFGGTYGQGWDLARAVKYNLGRNGVLMAIQLVGIPIAFNFGKKMLAKPVIRPANKLLKMAGIEGSVKL